MSTSGTSELRWMRAVRGHHEHLPLVVGAGVARRLDPHPLGRILDLFLVEDEADVALLSSGASTSTAIRTPTALGRPIFDQRTSRS